MNEGNDHSPHPVPDIEKAAVTGGREPWGTPTLRVLSMPQTMGKGAPTPMEGTFYGPS